MLKWGNEVNSLYYVDLYVGIIYECEWIDHVILKRNVVGLSQWTLNFYVGKDI